MPKQPHCARSAGAFPAGWSDIIKTVLGNATADAASVDALLAPHAGVPTFLRMPSNGEPLYDSSNNGKSDARLRAIGRLRVSDKKLLAKALDDEFARSLEGFEIGAAGAAGVLAERLSSSTIERVRFLDVIDAPVKPGELSALLAHPKLATLERLHYSGRPLVERFAIIAKMPAASHVEALILGGCDKLSKKDFAAFADRPWNSVRTFCVASTDYIAKDNAREPLWSAPWLKSVRDLGIGDLKASDATQIAAAGVAETLESLDVLATTVTEADIVPLFARLRSCTYLGWSGIPLGIDAARALIESGCVPHLEAAPFFADEAAKAALADAGLNAERVRATRNAERGWWYKW